MTGSDLSDCCQIATIDCLRMLCIGNDGWKVITFYSSVLIWALTPPPTPTIPLADCIAVKARKQLQTLSRLLCSDVIPPSSTTKSYERLQDFKNPHCQVQLALSCACAHTHIHTWQETSTQIRTSEETSLYTHSHTQICLMAPLLSRQMKTFRTI